MPEGQRPRVPGCDGAGTAERSYPMSEALMAQLVKNLPVIWETWVQSLGWEDPLEKGRSFYSSILA